MADSISINNYLKLFLKFSREEKLKIAERINQLTFEERWVSLGGELPDVEMNPEEVMKEVSAVRYARKK